MTKKKLSPWNNNLEFIQSLQPETNFNPDNLPKEPNYFETESWAAFPGKDGFQNLSPDIPPSLDDKEIEYLLKLVQEEAYDSSRPNEINIEKLAQLMVPSDDIMGDLTNKANE